MQQHELKIVGFGQRREITRLLEDDGVTVKELVPGKTHCSLEVLLSDGTKHPVGISEADFLVVLKDFGYDPNAPLQFTELAAELNAAKQDPDYKVISSS